MAPAGPAPSPRRLTATRLVHRLVRPANDAGAVGPTGAADLGGLHGESRRLADEPDAVHVKASSGPEIVRRGTQAGYRYRRLASRHGPDHRIEPLLVSLTERTEELPRFQHSGVELLYMLDGVMDYGYGRRHYRMEPGDTLQFDGDIAHGPTELVELPIRFLSVTIDPGAD